MLEEALDSWSPRPRITADGIADANGTTHVAARQGDFAVAFVYAHGSEYRASARPPIPSITRSAPRRANQIEAPGSYLADRASLLNQREKHSSSRGESARQRARSPGMPYSRQVGAIGPVAHLGAPRDARLERGPRS